MTRIAPLHPANASPATAETLAGVKAKLGLLPNLITTLAHSPGALNGYLALSGALADSLLDARQREIVALAIGQANECGYCLAAHTTIGKGAGLNAESIAAARRGEGNTSSDAALARFARVLTETRGNATDSEYQAFLAGGFSPAQALDVVALVALNTLTNYTNHLAGTVVDFPAVPLQQAA
ncbi:MAG: carboxymuconolactone decarboxylase family protein [Lysobacteraceae bacterium]